MSSSVVQTNRAVYAESEISTLSQSTPCGEPLPVVVEVLACGADQGNVAAEHADGERHVARHAAAVHHQVVDEEAQRHLLQVIGQQLLGEAPGNRIRWSVAIEPVTAMVTKRHPSFVKPSSITVP